MAEGMPSPPSGEESQEKQGARRVLSVIQQSGATENPGPLASDLLPGWKQLDAVPMLPV